MAVFTMSICGMRLVCVTLLRCFSSPAQPRFIQTTHRHPAGATRHPHGEPEESLDLCSGLGPSTSHSYWTIQHPILNALQQELRDVGFTILGFSMSSLSMWPPSKNIEDSPSSMYVRPGNGFVPNFQLFEKVDVNGVNEHALFTILKNACPPVGDSFGNHTKRLFWEPLRVNEIKWNFEKFLVGPDGRPVMRWFPRVSVSEVRADILKYFRQLVQKAD
nr:glutathione peroxidase [Cyprinus carpio]